MVGHDQVCIGADHELAQVHVLLSKSGHLLQEHTRVDHHPVRQDAHDSRVEDSRGYQVQPEGLSVVDYGVPCIVSTLVAYDEVGLAGQHVHQLAFSLVPPLTTYNHSR